MFRGIHPKHGASPASDRRFVPTTGNLAGRTQRNLADFSAARSFNGYRKLEAKIESFEKMDFPVFRRLYDDQFAALG